MEILKMKFLGEARFLMGQRQQCRQVRHISDEEHMSYLVRHLVAAAEWADEVQLGAGLKGNCRVVRRDENFEACLVQMGREEGGA